MTPIHPPLKPAEYAEEQVILAILEGRFPVNSTLPGERELAAQFGVTRPTLREVLQRLARDGWIDIQQGKPTRVCDYLLEGNLAVLSEIARHQERVSDGFTADLLLVRELLAPTYIRMAVEQHAEAVQKLLERSDQLEDDPRVFTEFDWLAHRQFASLSGNAAFPLLLNGFRDLYLLMGERYFMIPGAIGLSRGFYAAILEAAEKHDGKMAETVSLDVMKQSRMFWAQLSGK